MVYPAGYDPRRTYPIVVLLPASNGTSLAMYRSYPPPSNAIYLLAAGTGRTADYATAAAWSATINRYERQLLGDLAALESKGLRLGPVILAGFSMGGDLSWALTLRNPERVRGAVIFGSRASYRADAAAVRTLAGHNARIFFAMGRNEDAARVAGARAAIGLLEQSHIAHRYEEVPGAAHERFGADVFQRGLAFVLEGH